MKSRTAAAITSALISVLAITTVGCGSDSGASEPAAHPRAADLFNGERAFGDLSAQVAIGPRTSGSRGGRREVKLIRSRLHAADVTRVHTQKPWHNVVATIPGTKPGAIIAGAHWDTKDGVPNFVGADDGASGVAVLLELARSLPHRVSGPSIQLVFFDAEEARGNRDFETDGTRGSRQYVRYAEQGGRQGSKPLRQIKAMVLYDMVGDCDLQIPYEGLSDLNLYAQFANAAKKVNGSDDAAPFRRTAHGGVLDDHIPFAHAGVPAVDLIDFDYGPGSPPGAYWHTAEDTVDKVCPGSLDAVGEASMRTLPYLAKAAAKADAPAGDG